MLREELDVRKLDKKDSFASALNINRLRYHYDFIYDADEKKYRGLDILQIGDLICSDGYTVDEHRQWCHEISLILSGEADFIVDQTVYKVKEGDLILCPHGSMHSIKATSESMRYLYLGFSIDLNHLDLAQEELSFLQKANSYFLDPPHILVHDLQYVIQPFTLLVNEFSNLDEFSQVSIRSQLMSLITMVMRAGQDVTVTRSSTNEEAVYSGLICKVVRLLEANDYKISQVSQVADMLGYSKYYLSHLFKDKTGMTMQRFISEMRVKKSMELFSIGHTSITEVAEYLNFNNVQTFSRSFKNINGMTPSQYIKALHERRTKDV